MHARLIIYQRSMKLDNNNYSSKTWKKRTIRLRQLQFIAC